MDTITKFFKEENDYLYQRAEERKNHLFVKNLLLELGSSDEQAARLADVPVEYVAKVRAELQNK